MSKRDKAKSEWEMLTTSTPLTPELEADLVELSSPGFEKKNGVKVPLGMFAESRDTFDIPRMSLSTVSGVADLLGKVTADDFRAEQLRIATSEHAAPDFLKDPKNVSVVDALIELGSMQVGTDSMVIEGLIASIARTIDQLGQTTE